MSGSVFMFVRTIFNDTLKKFPNLTSDLTLNVTPYPKYNARNRLAILENPYK